MTAAVPEPATWALLLLLLLLLGFGGVGGMMRRKRRQQDVAVSFAWVDRPSRERVRL